jgi:phosphomannomutase
MRKEKFAVPAERLAGALDAIRQKWPEAVVNALDGLRLDGPDWWLHVRPSNTEPVVRVIAEAPAVEQVEELVSGAGAVLRGSA